MKISSGTFLRTTVVNSTAPAPGAAAAAATCTADTGPGAAAPEHVPAQTQAAAQTGLLPEGSLRAAREKIIAALAPAPHCLGTIFIQRESMARDVFLQIRADEIGVDRRDRRV